jgi:hypothetical protein
MPFGYYLFRKKDANLIFFMALTGNKSSGDNKPADADVMIKCYLNWCCLNSISFPDIYSAGLTNLWKPNLHIIRVAYENYYSFSVNFTFASRQLQNLESGQRYLLNTLYCFKSLIEVNAAVMKISPPM